MGLAQVLLLHLSHSGARQGIDDEHPLRLLEAREAVGQAADHLLLGQRRPLLAHNHGHHPLAEIGVRDSDHRALDDARQQVDSSSTSLGYPSPLRA